MTAAPVQPLLPTGEQAMLAETVTRITQRYGREYCAFVAERSLGLPESY